VALPAPVSARALIMKAFAPLFSCRSLFAASQAPSARKPWLEALILRRWEDDSIRPPRRAAPLKHGMAESNALGWTPIRPPRRAAPLKLDTEAPAISLNLGYPPSSEGGSVEASTPSMLSPSIGTYPPSSEGGSVEARKRRDRPPRGCRYPPSSEGGSVEA